MRKGRRRTVSIVAGVALVLAGVALLCRGFASTSARADEELPPLYLTIVVHNEEDTSRGAIPKVNIPDYDGDEEVMHHFAEAMRALAAMAADHGARISFGSDWTFSRGVARFEPSFYADLEALGHEVDAHAHQSHILYHEVREEIALAGGRPTHVASGLNEEEIQEEFDYLDAYYPEFQILWGVSLPGHGAGECVATWAWRPSRTDWTRHDPDGRYLYIGHGELVNSVPAIRQAVENRQQDRINTCAVFVSTREFKAAEGQANLDPQWTAPTDSIHFWKNKLAWWDGFLTQIDLLVETGVVQYATLTEIAAVFGEEEEHLDFDFGEVPRSDASMRTRNAKSGYPLD